MLCGIALDEWIEKGIALGAVWFLASLQILSTSAYGERDTQRERKLSLYFNITIHLL